MGHEQCMSLQARYPLIQRVAAAASDAANGTATQAGGPDRYLLQANFTGMEGFESFLYSTSVMYNLLVVYAFVQALVLILMLCTFIQRWSVPLLTGICNFPIMQTSACAVHHDSLQAVAQESSSFPKQ